MRLLIAFLILQGAPPRSPEEPHPDVPQARVDEAIRKGIEFLRTAPSPDAEKGIKDSDELILLTFIHAGAADDALLKKVLEKPLERTYSVSLQAMCLEQLDRVKHQPRLVQCAQFLIDNMMDNGRWAYGAPSEFASTMTPSKPAKKVAVQKRKVQPGNGGDNSNSQYAALGLRACHDAGIVFPKELIEKARKSWVDGEQAAKGWCYAKGPHGKCEMGGGPYESMTAGAVSALCIYDFMLGRDWKADPAVVDGLTWLDKNWSVTENVGGSETGGPGKGPKSWHLYSLYAIERVGMLYYSSKIGTHDWYKEGALLLLDSQAANGAWKMSHSMNPTWDTCFAILFLKRATRPMVASLDPLRRR